MNYTGQALENPGKYIVVKGPTVLYKRSHNKLDENSTPIYNPFTMDDGKYLVTLRDAIVGDKRAQDSVIFASTYVRSGWIEPGFNSLQWLKLSDLVEGHYNNTLTAQEKRKLMEVARLLFISIKQIPRAQSEKERKAKVNLAARKSA